MFMLDNSNRVVANWLQIVLDYRFDVIHIPGVTNIAPDHLSRIYADHKWGEGRGAHFFKETEAQAPESDVPSIPNTLHPTQCMRAGSARRVTFN
jgi:hypothetical protein